MSEVGAVQVERLNQILFPHAMRRRAELEGKHLVYYTTAETGLKIVQNGEIWLRDPRCMNDRSEIAGGFRKLFRSFEDRELRSAFDSALEQLSPGLAAKVFNRLERYSSVTNENTYIMCLSEHDPKSQEHQVGRLSMWRAYGGAAGGVAMVLKPPANSSLIPGLTAQLSPVGYFDSIHNEANELIQSVKKNIDYLRRVPIQILEELFHAVMLMAAVSVKDPVFLEEREWRLVYLTQYPSQMMSPDVVSINGIPQIIYKLPLSGHPLLELENLLDRIIIGPTNYPGTIKSAFEAALRKKGVTKFEQRVVLSNIPLRVRS